MRQLFVTPYTLATRVCSGVSSPLPPEWTQDVASVTLTQPGAKVLRSTDRLTLIDLDGVNGLAVSDIIYVAH